MAEDKPVRSVRVDDKTWTKATKRAAREGTTMNAVLALFTKGYAEGHLSAPRVEVVYPHVAD